MKRLVVVFALLVAACSPAETLSMLTVRKAIVDWNIATFGVPVGATSLECPDSAPLEANYSFICVMTDPSGSWTLKVTVLNEHGDVQWEVLGPA